MSLCSLSAITKNIVPLPKRGNSKTNSGHPTTKYRNVTTKIQTKNSHKIESSLESLQHNRMMKSLKQAMT